MKRFSGYLITALILGFLGLMPLFRGVIYPTERIFFSLITIVLFILLEIRQLKFSRNSKKLLSKYPLIPLLWLIGLLIHCFLVSERPYESLVRWFDYLSAVLYFYMALSLGLNQKRKKFLFIGLSLIVTFYAMHAILIYLGILPQQWWENPNFVSGTYVNHNHFAGLLELGIFLQIGIVLNSSKDKLFLSSLALLIQISALILSMSRGAWLAIFFSLIILACFLSFKRAFFKLSLKIFLETFVLVTLFLVIVYANYIPALSTRFYSFFETSSQFEFLDFRVKLWQSTILAIKDAPYFGHGLLSFSFAMLPYRQKGFEFSFDYAHQDYLQFLMEMGFIFTIPLVFYCLSKIILGIKNIYTEKLLEFRFESIGLSFGLLCLAFHGLSDFNFHIYSNLIIFAFALGIVSKPQQTLL